VAADQDRSEPHTMRMHFKGSGLKNLNSPSSSLFFSSVFPAVRLCTLCVRWFAELNYNWRMFLGNDFPVNSTGNTVILVGRK
jgi:hypothetical protein